jgi:hypothetical protein
MSPGVRGGPASGPVRRSFDRPAQPRPLNRPVPAWPSRARVPSRWLGASSSPEEPPRPGPGPGFRSAPGPPGPGPDQALRVAARGPKWLSQPEPAAAPAGPSRHWHAGHGGLRTEEGGWGVVVVGGGVPASVSAVAGGPPRRSRRGLSDRLPAMLACSSRRAEPGGAAPRRQAPARVRACRVKFVGGPRIAPPPPGPCVSDSVTVRLGP